MRTVSRVYRPYEILKGIRHCRLPGLSRDRRLLCHSYSQERLLLTEFFKNSSHPSLGLQSLSVSLSPIGDPLSSRINRTLSRRKVDSRARRHFFLYIRSLSLSNFPPSFSFYLPFSFSDLSRFSVVSLNVDKSVRTRERQRRRNDNKRVFQRFPTNGNRRLINWSAVIDRYASVNDRYKEAITGIQNYVIPQFEVIRTVTKTAFLSLFDY